MLCFINFNLVFLLLFVLPLFISHFNQNPRYKVKPSTKYLYLVKKKKIEIFFFTTIKDEDRYEKTHNFINSETKLKITSQKE